MFANVGRAIISCQLMVAILLRPWVHKMRTLGLVPRVLADDVLLTAHGEHCTDNFARGLYLTHEYLNDIGVTSQTVASFDGQLRRTRRFTRSLLWASAHGLTELQK